MGSIRQVTDHIVGWAGTVIHLSLVRAFTLGGWVLVTSAGGDGLVMGSVVGSIVGTEAGLVVGWVCSAGCWTWNMHDWSCVGVVEGLEPSCCQFSKRLCRSVIALSWLPQEISGASWRASFRTQSGCNSRLLGVGVRYCKNSCQKTTVSRIKVACKAALKRVKQW